MDDLRVTKGAARYTAAFTAPTKELEYYFPIASVVLAGGVTGAAGSRVLSRVFEDHDRRLAGEAGIDARRSDGWPACIAGACLYCTG